MIDERLQDFYAFMLMSNARVIECKTLEDGTIYVKASAGYLAVYEYWFAPGHTESRWLFGPPRDDNE